MVAEERKWRETVRVGEGVGAEEEGEFARKLRGYICVKALPGNMITATLPSPIVHSTPAGSGCNFTTGSQPSHKVRNFAAEAGLPSEGTGPVTKSDCFSS